MMRMSGGVTLGFLKYVLGFDSITFRRGMTDAERDLVKLQKSFERRGKDLQKLGKGLTAFITLPIAGIAAAGIKEAQETQQAMAQVNASLASMGPVAGRSAEQLKKVSDALELKSTFEADEILRKVTANLLTFGNISGTVFDRAQQSAVDLATKLGTDLQSATILVGKALNDPIKGLTALGRAGIQFSESQKETIKSMVATGNVAGAQSIILGELERQFKGSAAAAANADPLNQANKAWKQMAETIGNSLLPILPQITAAVSAVANAFGSLSPGMQQTIIVTAGVAAAVGPLLIGFGGLLKLVAAIGPAVTALAGAWKLLQAGFIAARVAALATLPALTPFLIPLAAIAAAVGVAYLAWKNWDKIKAIVSSVYNAVKTAFVDKLNVVWDWIKKKVGGVVELFRWMWDKLVGHSYVPDTVDAISDHFGRLGAVMVAPAEKATKAVSASFQQLKDDVSGLLDQLFPEEADLRDRLAELKLLDDAAAKGVISPERQTAARLRVLGVPSEARVDLGDAAEGPDQMVSTIDALVAKMPVLVDRTQQWGDALREIGKDLLGRIGDDLASIVSGSMKLKDLWRDLLGFGIRALTSSSGPLGALLGGARAEGGPVLSGTPYLVGERGPEIFMPSSSGRIISNRDSRALAGRGAGVGWSGDMIVYANDADSFGRSERQITRSLRRRLA
jgi:hypothetical protein